MESLAGGQNQLPGGWMNLYQKGRWKGSFGNLPATLTPTQGGARISVGRWEKANQLKISGDSNSISFFSFCFLQPTPLKRLKTTQRVFLYVRRTNEIDNWDGTLSAISLIWPTSLAFAQTNLSFGSVWGLWCRVERFKGILTWKTNFWYVLGQKILRPTAKEPGLCSFSFLRYSRKTSLWTGKHPREETWFFHSWS